MKERKKKAAIGFVKYSCHKSNYRSKLATSEQNIVLNKRMKRYIIQSIHVYFTSIDPF